MGKRIRPEEKSINSTVSHRRSWIPSLILSSGVKVWNCLCDRFSPGPPPYCLMGSLMKIEMGVTPKSGDAALLDVEELLATRLLVQGNSGSGKSHLLRRLLEQSAPHVQQVIIDPEGDFVSLSDEYGHVVVDANRSTGELETIAARVREHRVSAVLNLESLDVDQQMKAAAIFLNALFDAPREIWYPCLVVVDEAQLFAPAAAGDAGEEARRVSLGAMTNLMCRGRKRGLAGVIATQRLAKLAKNVAAEASNFLMGRTFLDIDMARAADLLGMDRREAEKFRDLGRGSFIALGPALSRKPLPIQVGNVITKARGSTPKLTKATEMSAEEANALILAPVPSAARADRRPVLPPAASVDDVLSQVTAVAVATEAAIAAEAPAEQSDAPAAAAVDRMAVYRGILFDMMRDPEAAFSPEPALFQEFQTRIRIKRMGGKLPDLPQFKALMVFARAGIDPVAPWVADEANPWPAVFKILEQIPADLRSVYLMFAKAAIEQSPCPSDATIARVLGSHSAGRGQSKVKGLEQQGFIVIKNDLRGHRIVSLPDFQMETLAGDPKAMAEAA